MERNCVGAGEHRVSLRRLELHELSDREKDVLELYALGFVQKEIAVKLGIRKPTVRNHLQNIRAVLGARNSVHAVAIAMKQRKIRPKLR